VQRLRELSARAQELRASRQRLVAAQDEERRRLERDIHDGAQQHLVALAVNLRLAQAVARTSPGRAAEVLLAQARAAGEAMDAVVGLSRGIYPPVLSDRGIPAAIEAVAGSTGLPVRVEADRVGRYPAAIEAAVYFSCLEALQNAVKHSGARQVRVHLSGAPDALTVTIEDDGRGFDPERVAAGAGLANMRDRIDAVGGVLRVETAPSDGVRVRLRVPVPAGPVPAGPVPAGPLPAGPVPVPARPGVALDGEA
jgi:signal transduction histidine kinase